MFLPCVGAAIKDKSLAKWGCFYCGLCILFNGQGSSVLEGDSGSSKANQTTHRTPIRLRLWGPMVASVGPKMKLIRTYISVSGFSSSEAAEGIPALLEEFRERSYIHASDAQWNAESKTVDLWIEVEGDDPDEWKEFAEDQAWDCVIACINFSSEGITFNTTEVERRSEQ